MSYIGFTDDPVEYPYDDESIPAAPGYLMLGERREDFLANLALWSKADYEAHWKRELESLLAGGSKGALIVEYNDPTASSKMEVWPIYRDGNVVHFQNRFLPHELLPKDFTPHEISQHIRDRSQFSEDGNKLSEWDIPIQGI